MDFLCLDVSQHTMSRCDSHCLSAGVKVEGRAIPLVFWLDVGSPGPSVIVKNVSSADTALLRVLQAGVGQRLSAL